MNDCEWPEVPEFYCDLPNTLSDSSQMQKLLLNPTEVEVRGERFIDCLTHVTLGKCSVLKLCQTYGHNLKYLNNVLKQGFVPNLSKLVVNGTVLENERINTFLHELDPNNIVKLEKLALKGFVILAEDLQILIDKLNSHQMTELHLWNCYGLRGSLSVLFTHSLPTLKCLTLRLFDLNSDDVQSLVEAETDGKLPRLKYLDILGSWINNLFTHSAKWNQLTIFATSDANVLNVEPEFLASLEDFHLKSVTVKSTPQITRRWPRLKVIEVWDNSIARCIADGVERDMFPTLTTIRGNVDVTISLLFTLYRANISVEINQFHSVAGER